MHGFGCGGEVQDVAGALDVVGDVGGEDADDVGVAAVGDADMRVGAGSAESEDTSTPGGLMVTSRNVRSSTAS
jgi:hypothetical protein